MSWLTEFVRPKIQKLVRRTDVPENLWHKCKSCEQMIFHRDLAKNNHVCQHCGHHMRISAKDRLATLFDDGKYQTIELPNVPVDPLRFRDQKKYTDRLKAAQAKATFKDALAVAHGEVGGHATVVAVFDFSFMGGSMGIAVGEGIVAAAELACVQDAALIIVPASGGARMQEGILSLMQMPKATVMVRKLRQSGLPYIVLLTDPTTGGVTASYAMLGDVQIAEPGALIGFAGQRVIQETIREQLPEGFQRAEYLHEHGMVDRVVHRHDLKGELAMMLRYMRGSKAA